MKKTFLPVVSLRQFSPFRSTVWAYDLDRPITQKEVRQAIQDGRFLDMPVNSLKQEDQFIPLPRHFHVERVAFLVKNGWGDAIEIDVGVPSMRCYVDWPIIDGNHRLAAAIFRRDEQIEVGVGGDIDYAADLFNVPAESLLLEEDPLPG